MTRPASPSPEAVRALREAQRAKASTHAVEPLVDDLRERLVVAMTQNHFANLFERMLAGPRGEGTVDLR